MSDDEARLALLDAFARRYNEHDVDAIMELMTEDCVFVSYFGPDPDGERFAGAAGVGQRIASFLASHPDAQWAGARHFVSGDRGVSEWLFSATDRGTGERIERQGCDLFTFRGDRIATKDTYQKWRLRRADRHEVEVPAIHAPVGRYAHAVRHKDLLFVSGCGPFGLDGALVGGDDVALQTEQTLSNLQAILQAAGTGFSRVLRETVYLKDIDDRAATREVRQRFFGATLPASTLIEVSRLVHPRMKIEIDAIASVGD